MIITLDANVVRLEDNYIESDFNDELMLMNLETGDYTHINAIGKVIWLHLGTSSSVKELCQELVAKYEVDLETCEKDVLEFLNKLLGQSIIGVS